MARRRHGALLALALLMLAGCPARIKGYAPRLHNTDFHRDAVERRNCADCHDAGKIKFHSAQDYCTSCHILCRGC